MKLAFLCLLKKQEKRPDLKTNKKNQKKKRVTTGKHRRVELEFMEYL